MKLDIHDPPPAEDQRELEDLLSGPCRETAARRLGQRQSVHFSRENGQPVLRILAAPDGSAVRTISRRKNGTLRDSMGPENGKRAEPLFRRYDQELEQLEQLAMDLLTEETVSRLGAGRYAMLCGNSWRPGGLRSVNTARVLVHEACARGTFPGGQREVSPDEIHLHASRLIRQHFMEPRAYSLAKELAGRTGDITAPLYNRAVRNLPGLWELSQTNIHMARLYFDLLAGNRRGPRTAAGILRDIARLWDLGKDQMGLLQEAAKLSLHLDRQDPGGTARAVCLCLQALGAVPGKPLGNAEKELVHNASRAHRVMRLGPEAEQEWLTALPEIVSEQMQEKQLAWVESRMRSRRRSSVPQVFRLERAAQEIGLKHGLGKEHKFL